MLSWTELAEVRVDDLDGFLRLLRLLRDELSKPIDLRGDSTNYDLEAFLEGMGAWLDDARKARQIPDNFDWKFAGELLFRGWTYE